jgi:hypothetical protein
MTSARQTVSMMQEAKLRFEAEHAELIKAYRAYVKKAESMAEYLPGVFVSSFDGAIVNCSNCSVVRVDVESSPGQVVVCYEPMAFYDPPDRDRDRFDLSFPLEWLDLPRKDLEKAYKGFVKDRIKAAEESKRAYLAMRAREEEEKTLREIQELEERIALLKATL